MAPRQPSRKALYIPFLLLLVVGVVWTFVWFWMRAEMRERMDAGAERLRAAGYTVSWEQRTLGGYPFRLDANLRGLRIGEPSGWAIEAPSIRAEAFVYSLNHWVAVAPQGVVLQRPVGGPLAIQGRALRASLRDLDQHPARIAVEGANLTFTPGDGAQPFLLRSAEQLDLHLRPGPQGQGAILFRVTGAQANLPGLLARVADDRPVDMNVELILSHMDAMRGRDWRTMAQRWSSAGGTATVRTASLTVGDAVLAANGGGLSVGADGRVEGGLSVDLAKAGEALSDMTGGMVPPTFSFGGASLTFDRGQTRLGPLPIAPAPRVY